jgi:hypothetical protein
MSFTDPTSVTVATVAKSLARVSTSDNKSTYRNSDGTIQLDVSHAYGRRNRSLLKFTFSKTAADPLVTGTNVVYSTSVQLILDRDKSGWTLTELTDQVVAMADYLKASSNANSIKFIGGEN